MPFATTRESVKRGNDDLYKEKEMLQKEHAAILGSIQSAQDQKKQLIDISTEIKEKQYVLDDLVKKIKMQQDFLFSYSKKIATETENYNALLKSEIEKQESLTTLATKLKQSQQEIDALNRLYDKSELQIKLNETKIANFTAAFDKTSRELLEKKAKVEFNLRNVESRLEDTENNLKFASKQLMVTRDEVEKYEKTIKDQDGLKNDLKRSIDDLTVQELGLKKVIKQTLATVEKQANKIIDDAQKKIESKLAELSKREGDISLNESSFKEKMKQLRDIKIELQKYHVKPIPVYIPE